jgi:predicted permease
MKYRRWNPVTWGWLEMLLRNLVYGIHGLRARPGFTLTAVFSLALGIGANSAIFSILDGMYLRPPAIEKPGELVRLFSTNPDGSYNNTSVQDYRDFAVRARTLSGVACRKDMIVSFRTGLKSRYLNSLVVSENYFATIKPSFAEGRGFTPEDMRGNQAWPAVVSYQAWKSELGGVSQIIGKDVLVENQHFTIVGVLSSQFKEIDNLGAAQIYVPLEAWRVIDSTNPDYRFRDVRVLTLLGRRNPLYSMEQVQSELSLIAAQLARSFPGSNHNIGMQAIADFKYRVRSTGDFGLLLLVIIGFILLMACVNVAHLLLAQVDRRRKEFAIRVALGANRQALLQQLFTENLLLSVLGGGTGLLVAYALIHGLPLWQSSLDGFIPTFQIDLRVITFSMLLAVLTSLLFGMIPAWRSSKPALVMDLKSGPTSPAAGPVKLRFRSLLIVGQLAITLVLLTGTGLLVKSLRNLIITELGFPRKNLLTLMVSMQNPKPEALQSMLDQWVAKVKTIPGVKAASYGRRVPVVPSVGGHWQEIYVSSSLLPTDQKNLFTSYNSIGLDFLKTMGIPVLHGRDFNQFDTAKSPRVLIINENMAQRFWPNEDPLGEEVWLGGKNHQKAVIVGIAKDTKVEMPWDLKSPYYYVPFSQDFRPFAYLVVESWGDSMRLLSPIRAALSELNPEIPSGQVMTLKQSLELKAGDRTRISLLVGILGGIGLVLAVVGLYGIIAYVANQRTREIGIRMALGAQINQVVWLVLKQGVILILGGLAMGVLFSSAFTRLIEGMLFGVSPMDLTALLGGAFVLIGVALLACYVPARRASRVNPMVTLRAE